ncbi:hypothetical protein [Microbulbifer discodermiae]|uniref:hypothetical protein n=1 Tax=Microbulbifer sp. 2201CG32-9 TaxID=3232309 RepID=UPI00345BF7DC
MKSVLSLAFAVAVSLGSISSATSSSFEDMNLWNVRLQAEDFLQNVDSKCELSVDGVLDYSEDSSLHVSRIRVKARGSSSGSVFVDAKYTDPVSPTKFRVTLEDTNLIPVSNYSTPWGDECPADSVFLERVQHNGNTHFSVAKHVYYQLNIAGFNRHHYPSHDTQRLLQSVEVTSVFPSGNIKTKSFLDMTGDWSKPSAVTFQWGYYNTGESLTRLE